MPKQESDDSLKAHSGIRDNEALSERKINRVTQQKKVRTVHFNKDSLLGWFEALKLKEYDAVPAKLNVRH